MHSETLIDRRQTVDALALIRKAGTAPTGDNSQHWRFHWDGRTLRIFLHESRARFVVNNRDHASWLSLGCVLEILKLAASEQGFAPKEELDLSEQSTTPAPQRELREVARLQFVRADGPADPLALSIESRCTDRRPFRNTPLPGPLLAELQRLSLALPSVRLRFQPRPSEEFLDYAVSADEFLWRHPLALRDLYKWARLTDSECERAEDGLPWRSLGIGRLQVMALRLFRQHPDWVPRLWSLGLRSRVNAVSRKLLTHCSGLYCIAIQQPHAPGSVVDAGRVACRAWLALNRSGFGVQPLSFCSLPAFDLAVDSPPPGLTRDFRKLFTHGLRALRQEFDLRPTDLPVWIFRTGPIAAPPPESRSPRSPLENLLI